MSPVPLFCYSPPYGASSPNSKLDPNNILFSIPPKKGSFWGFWGYLTPKFSLKPPFWLFLAKFGVSCPLGPSSWLRYTLWATLSPSTTRSLCSGQALPDRCSQHEVARVTYSVRRSTKICFYHYKTRVSHPCRETRATKVEIKKLCRSCQYSCPIDAVSHGMYL